MWRPETHIFHLSCGECTITLKDVQLQLGLLMDGFVVTGTVHATNWKAVCDELLGLVSEIIFGGRIEMAWLRRNFSELDEDSTKVEREQHVQAYILMLIKGIIMPNKSRNFVHLRWLLKLVNFREVGELSWESTVLATLYQEMCRAMQPRKIKIGGCFLLLQSLARLFGKRYLLSEEYRSGQMHTGKPRGPQTHPRFGEAGPSVAPMQEPAPMPTPPPDQYVSSYFGSLFYQGGSSSQPPIPRLEDARCDDPIGLVQPPVG
ncbi:hypothetical protein J1N35_000865 [Gossypium stocksii]|uniref:Aminotransferase-like plant mobile domain-containing protein n=1 Tax=Gossypium stocksii TaxID=47602 RepID=A0A9D3WHW4_9ROSI|nr:hypothetical protein J1N35_000865 [Gossypium stocksii]